MFNKEKLKYFFKDVKKSDIAWNSAFAFIAILILMVFFSGYSIHKYKMMAQRATEQVMLELELEKSKRKVNLEKVRGEREVAKIQLETIKIQAEIERLKNVIAGHESKNLEGGAE